MFKDEEIKAPSTLRVLNISTGPAARKVTSTEWAELIDITHPVTDFEQRIPNPAFKFPFELDTFQKQVCFFSFYFRKRRYEFSFDWVLSPAIINCCVQISY